MNKKLIGTLALVAAGVVALPSIGLAARLVSPVDRGLMVGNRLPIIISKCLRLHTTEVTVDGAVATVRFDKDVYPARWLGFAEVATRGEHVLRVRGRCGLFRFDKTVRFSSVSSSLEVGRAVADQFIAENPAASLSWNWGPAIFLYGLLDLAETSGDPGGAYLSFVQSYHDHYAQAGLPSINNADRCAPTLTALRLANGPFDVGDRAPYRAQVEAAMDYVRGAERNALGTLNHLGSSFESLLYPDSIWIDSLMMWTLVTQQYAAAFGDSALAAFAAEQPALYRRHLEDPTTGLYYHARNTETGRLLPRDNVPWLRGNGWAMAFLVETLAQTDAHDPMYRRLADQLRSMVDGALAKRLPSKYWDTVVASPGRGYEEASGSALVAYAMAKGAALGALPVDYRELAKETFVAISSRMTKQANGYALEGVSLPTNPFPEWLYALWPTSNDQTYGVGAMLLLSAELAGESF